MDGSGISRRRTLQLTGAAVAGVALAHVVPSRAAANPASAAGVGPIAAVSRAPDRLDIFAVASNGGVYTSGWQPGDPNFSPWQRIGTLEVASCAPLAAVSRSTNKLDVFVTGLDGRVQQAAWEPGGVGWRVWTAVGAPVTVSHAHLSVVSHATDKLDVFVAGRDGRVYTADWQPGDGGFGRGSRSAT